MSLVVGIDPSLKCTGIARADGTATVVRFKDGRATPERIATIRDVVRQQLRNVSLAAIEGLSFGNYDTNRGLAGLNWTLRVALWEADVPYLVVTPSSLKRYATGNGVADKHEMIRAATERLGYEGTSSDEADALWLRAIGFAWLGEPIVDLPVEHLVALERLAEAAVGRSM